MNQLAVIENTTPAEIYSPGQVDAVIDRIQKEARSFVPDLKTVAGRKEIASLAYKIAQSKTFMDDCGKKLGEEAKKHLDTINLERKKIRETLDSLKEEIRKPLTDWEKEDEARKQKYRIDLDWLKFVTVNAQREFLYISQPEIEAIKNRVIALETSNWEEFALDANIHLTAASEAIKLAIEMRARHDEQQEELKKLRAEKEERDRKEAQRLEQEFKDREAKAELERKEFAKKQEIERAAREKQEATNREIKRLEREKQMALEKEEASKVQAEEKRLANVKHRTKINNEVLKALQHQGLTDDQGNKVITAIVSGLVPYAKINY